MNIPIKDMNGHFIKKEVKITSTCKKCSELLVKKRLLGPYCVCVTLAKVSKIKWLVLKFGAIGTLSATTARCDFWESIGCTNQELQKYLCSFFSVILLYNQPQKFVYIYIYIHIVILLIHFYMI